MLLLFEKCIQFALLSSSTGKKEKLTSKCVAVRTENNVAAFAQRPKNFSKLFFPPTRLPQLFRGYLWLFRNLESLDLLFSSDSVQEKAQVANFWVVVELKSGKKAAAENCSGVSAAESRVCTVLESTPCQQQQCSIRSCHLIFFLHSCLYAMEQTSKRKKNKHAPSTPMHQEFRKVVYPSLSLRPLFDNRPQKHQTTE